MSDGLASFLDSVTMIPGDNPPNPECGLCGGSGLWLDAEVFDPSPCPCRNDDCVEVSMPASVWGDILAGMAS